MSRIRQPGEHAPPARFRSKLLAMAAIAALVPYSAFALDLAQSPPGNVEPYVRPNVIISIDDSGSMGYRLDRSTSGGTKDVIKPNADGTWDPATPRINILKYSLDSIFNPASPGYDPQLMPDNKIRLAWQAMWNNGASVGVGPRKSSGSAGATSVDSDSSGVNSMRTLDQAHRDAFLDFARRLKPSGNTPAHWMFAQADGYMRRPLGRNSMWASEPGTRGEPYLACRRSYHILMTDGRWNSAPSGGQRDGANSLTLPDETVYADGTKPQEAKVALYRDGYADTLADWAFYSWSTPPAFAGSMTGSVQTSIEYRRAPSVETFGQDLAGQPATLERYWNPRYDPATWPHMTTYVIGASSDATTWPGAPTIFAPTSQTPFGYDGSFPDLVTGHKSWPSMDAENKRALDLWHAALNGRGRFYAVNKGEDLEKAFRDIFGQINTPPPSNPVASATSGSNITRVDVDRFTAAYEPINAWKGYVRAEIIQQDGTIVANAAWGGKNTADKLDAGGFDKTSRTILSWSDKTTGSAEQGGVPFQWASDESNLSTSQKTWLQKGVDGADGGATQGNGRLDYIRGDRSKEGSDGSGYSTTKPFRHRASRQGDIVNSVIWYTAKPSSDYALPGYSDFIRANVNRTPMVYVGGNDGMLHGFSATDGAEKIAYVPRGVIPALNRLTDPTFDEDHRFYVDGSPMTGDVDLSGNAGIAWHTLLVGTLGAGGAGYFVLDVTNPDGSGSVGPKFSEDNAKDLVLLDRSRSALELLPADCAGDARCEADKDIGFITAQPVLNDNNATQSSQITRMNNNRWAVILGNGYNSVNQRPVLLIQYLDGDLALRRIPATGDAKGSGNARDNGLASPRIVDLNGDGRADIVYAGDNLGNLWKFDLTSDDHGDWKVAFGGQPLFSASGPASLGSPDARTLAQPITAAPSVRANDRSMKAGAGTAAVGGLMVAFATGRNVSVDDAASEQVHTLYSVLDNTRYRYRAGDAAKPRDQQRLEVNPGSGTCGPVPQPDCVPAPRALGAGVAAAGLAQQKITEIDAGKAGTVGAASTDQELTAATWAGRNGWYLDLPAVGERVLKPMTFFDATNILAVYSQVPAKGKDVDPNVESCDSVTPDEERQFRTLINIMDGKAPSVQLVDYNGDGAYNAADQGVVRVQVSKGAHNLIARGDKVMDIDTNSQAELLARMPELSLRPSWRQLK